jgi:hypothetical protein
MKPHMMGEFVYVYDSILERWNAHVDSLRSAIISPTKWLTMSRQTTTDSESRDRLSLRYYLSGYEICYVWYEWHYFFLVGFTSSTGTRSGRSIASRFAVCSFIFDDAIFANISISDISLSHFLISVTPSIDPSFFRINFI